MGSPIYEGLPGRKRCRRSRRPIPESFVTTALQRSDLSELFTHWAIEPYQLLDIAIAVVLIVVGAWALRKLVRWLLTTLGRRKFLPAQLIEAARRAASSLIILVAILLVLKSLGVSARVLWSAMTGFLAVAAIAFFAAWSVLSNTFCALLLLTTRPFRVGDHVEVLENGEKPGLRGTVTAIHLIYTTLTENEPGQASSVLQVPNSLFFQRVVRRTGVPPEVGERV
jgi:small-conductance mechanosensitive channel